LFKKIPWLSVNTWTNQILLVAIIGTKDRHSLNHISSFIRVVISAGIMETNCEYVPFPFVVIFVAEFEISTMSWSFTYLTSVLIEPLVQRSGAVIYSRVAVCLHDLLLYSWRMTG
jgi:non-canonical (house-cleaning) NTP pyrophosphatase